MKNKLLNSNNKKKKKRAKNLSTYINSQENNDDKPKTSYQSYLLTEVKPRKDNFIYTDNENNYSIDDFDENNKKRVLSMEKYQEELNTTYNFYKPSKDTLEAFYNSNKNASRSKTTSNLYRDAIDRYQKGNNKKQIKFEFSEQYQSFRTKFFDSKEKIKREINNKNNTNQTQTEIYQKVVHDIDPNEKNMNIFLPYQNLNEQLKKDWKRVKEQLPVNFE